MAVEGSNDNLEILEAVERGTQPEVPQPLPTLLGQCPSSQRSLTKTEEEEAVQRATKHEAELQQAQDQLEAWSRQVHAKNNGKGAGKGKKGGCLKKLMRMDPMVTVAAAALVLLVASVLTGIILEFGFDINAGPRRPHVSPCLLEQLGYNPALAMSPWNLANPQWVFGMCLVITFILRMFVFTFAARFFYGHLAANKQVKVANYMLELFGTTLALILCIWAGFFDLLLHPDDYVLPTPDQAYRFAVGAQQTCVLFLVVYTSELYSDPEMRLGLKLHHWTAITLALWGLAAMHILHNSVMLARCFFVVSLYMSTEQNVFVEMLMYQRRIYLPKLFYLSAAYYFLTRAAIMIVSLRTWWETRDEVFGKSLADSWVVYSLWLFIPLANAVLNASQLTTVQSLLGIAASVWERCAELAVERSLHAEIESCACTSPSHSATEPELSVRQRRATKRATERLLNLQIHVQLVDIFGEIDFDQRGTLTREAWLSYVSEQLRDEWLIPRSTFEELYDEIKASGRGGTVTLKAFSNFFSRYMLGRAEFKLVLMAIAVQRVHATPGIDLNLQALLERRHRAIVGQLLQQHRERSAAYAAGGWASDGGSSAAAVCSAADSLRLHRCRSLRPGCQAQRPGPHPLPPEL